MKSMQSYYNSQRAENTFSRGVGYRQYCSGSETDVSASTSTENLTHEEKYVLQNSTRQEPQGEEDLENKGTDFSYNTLIIHENLSNIGFSSATEKPPFTKLNMNPESPVSSDAGEASSLSKVMLKTSCNIQGVIPYRPSSYCFWQKTENSPTSVQDLTQQYHTVDAQKEQKQFSYSLPPPPEYPNCSDDTVVMPVTFKSVSRSQPDLSKLGLKCFEEKSRSRPSLPRPKTRGRASMDGSYEGHFTRSSNLVEILTEENHTLKYEIDICHRKITRLQEVEREVQKISQSYEDLVKSSEKRECLSRTVRMKLELELKRLQDVCKGLNAQLDVATMQLNTKEQVSGVEDTDLKKELNRRDLLITQLISQNKELMAAKERQEIEITAQRATLQEQRTHIDILDSALQNSQTTVVKLEEECLKKQAYVDRVGQLQKALQSLQMASERREQMEKKLRNQLEKELKELRENRKEGQHDDEGDNNNEMSELKCQLREREEKFMALQAEVSKWEQRYLEESAIRQIAIDAASMPKDAKIAALEKTSQESERMIAQARSEQLRQMDELHATNKRCADIEARAKDLESKLAEKDAMIKVLQKQSLEKDAAYQSAILRSPRHTPHTSLHAAMSTITGSEDHTDTVSNEGHLSKVACASSSSTLGLGASMTKSPGSKSFDSTIDRQLKELDSKMLSKDSIIQALRAEKEKYPNHFWRV